MPIHPKPPGLLDHIDIGIIIINDKRNIIFINKWLIDHGIRLQTTVLDQSFESLFPELADSRVSEAINQALTTGYPSIISNVFNRSPFPLYPTTQSEQGADARIQQTISVSEYTPPEDGSSRHCLIQINDVTAAVMRERALEKQVSERRQAQQALAQERSLFVAGPSVVFKWRATEDLPIEYISPNVHTQLGYDSEQLINGNISFKDIIHPDDLKSVLNEIHIYSEQNVPHFEQEYRIRNQAGEYRWFHGVIVVIRHADNTIANYHGYMQDITERKLAEAEVSRLAYYDVLTDLPNRRLFLDRLEQELSLCRRIKQFSAVFFLDLDRFKSINDTLGHSTGDALLNLVAERLKANIRTEDTVARIGGDEFLVLLTQLGASSRAANKAAYEVSQKLQAALNKPFCVNDQDIKISPSIGICLFSSQEESGEAIIKYADTAMYQVKQNGRNSSCFYKESMGNIANQRIRLEKDLAKAIQRNEFSLHFQPQTDAQGKVFAAECLIRWQHPKRGMVSPAEFIPVAEETNLIVDIGDWVLQTACSELQHWKASNLTHLDYLAVNVSPKQFHKTNFVDKVIALIQKTGINAKQLVLEITEGLLITDINDAVIKIKSLKSYGIRFAIDDFGTGYSSLAYLHRLPLDILKIDRSFVYDIAENNAHAPIVNNIISMAQNLNLHVVAEGVEQEHELQYLISKECTKFQGYYFFKPMPENEFRTLIFDSIHSTQTKESTAARTRLDQKPK